MKIPVLLGAVAFALSGCGTEPVAAPTLPEGVATSSFTFVDDSFLRGVTGTSQTVPRGRPAAILDVTYGLTCIADGAQARLGRAQQILDTKFVAAPLFFANPRERGQWRREAANAVNGTGCIVTGLSYESRTTDPIQTGMWAIQNRVPPA